MVEGEEDDFFVEVSLLLGGSCTSGEATSPHAFGQGLGVGPELADLLGQLLPVRVHVPVCAAFVKAVAEDRPFSLDALGQEGVALEKARDLLGPV